MGNRSFSYQYTFLKEIPLSILIKMDLNCLDFPTEEQACELRKLEKKLKSNIAIYKKGYVPSGIHLCRTIYSSELNTDEQGLIKRFEKLFLNSETQIAVAYEKPVRLI